MVRHLRRMAVLWDLPLTVHRPWSESTKGGEQAQDTVLSRRTHSPRWQ